jgi:8-amino-7-oxononanoate synthase
MALADPLQQVDRTFVLWRGRKLSYFGGCDYFRLASHPQVLRALADGAKKFGFNVAASRSTTGNHALYAELEEELANFFGAEAALLVASGYVTNIVAAQGVNGDFSQVLIDERSHPSLMDAMRFAPADAVIFSHRNAASVAAHVMRCERDATILLLTDGMFSHDGSAAPLREYQRDLPRTALMLVDDAHGAGVLGAQGRGTIEHAGISRAQTVQTISLSKAFGCYGGAVLCSKKFRDQIIERSRLFNGNTPLPLPLANAALTSVRLLKENPEWRARMNANAAHVKSALRQAGHDIPDTPGPIIAIHPRSDPEDKRVRARLLRHKVFPSFIRYAGSRGYFRFMISSEHSRAQLNALIEALS